jgi:formylglycine-generating enzyme required for sulfatase activity
MAGNVWEWVNSIYKPYPYNAKDGREDTDGYGIHIIRGGAWFWFDYIPAGYHRVWLAPNNTYDLVGFRCASDP